MFSGLFMWLVGFFDGVEFLDPYGPPPGWPWR